MKKVVVIEDNENNRYLMRFILTKQGHDVKEAVSGEIGVAMVLSELPDLVIIDLQLPGIDGLEATRQIRAAETGRSVPILAVTSYAMSGDRERAMEAGCTGYVEKPIDPEHFAGELDKYL